MLRAALLLFWVASTASAQVPPRFPDFPKMPDFEKMQENLEKMQKKLEEFEEATRKRQAAIEAAAKEPDAVERMIERIANNDDVWFAAAVLVKVGEPALPALIEGLAHQSHTVRGVLPRPIARIGKSGPVVAALSHTDPLTRLGACRVLGLMVAPDTRAAVEAVLAGDADDSVRFWAAWATERLGGKAPDAAFVRGLKSADRSVRDLALRRLAGNIDILLANFAQLGASTQADVAAAMLPHRDVVMARGEQLLASPDAGVRRGVVMTLALVRRAHGNGVLGRGQRRAKHARRARDSEQAVDRAVAWLKRQQQSNGSWGQAVTGPTGQTALALLALMGAGVMDESVRKGLDRLIRLQSKEGAYGWGGSDSFQYGHALATLAMCEAACLIPLPRYRRSAQYALGYITISRSPDGGWGYVPGADPGHTVLTAWMMLAVDVGRRAGLDVPAIDPTAYLKARLDESTRGAWVIGYSKKGESASRPVLLRRRFPPEHADANNTAGVLIYLLAGKRGLPTAAVAKIRNRRLSTAPAWDPNSGSIDMASWYFASMMTAAISPSYAAKWQRALGPQILANQQPDGAWPPDGVWGRAGGPVYSTAILTLCLESPYLYASARKRSKPAKRAGVLLKRAQKDADPSIAKLARAALARK